MKTLLAAAATLFLTSSLAAQLTVPPASPRVTLTQSVGLAEVTLDYSRPGAKGRKIFDGLEPYGVVWRTGANASTKIGFDHDMLFGGEEVPAGTYSLYTIPGAKAWTVILNKNTDLWGAGGYDQADDLLRVRVPVTELDETWETFTIDFRGFHANGAELFMRWDDVEVVVPLFSDSDSIVMAQIEEHVINATGEVAASVYFEAAKYYVEREVDLTLAASWMEKAVDMRPDAFWMSYSRAELAHRMGQMETATAWATRARDTAAKADDDYGYVARSQSLLDELAAIGHGG